MLQLHNLEKHYGNQTILSPTSFIFPDGEKVGLVGPNGAGKSTLLNMICGLESPDDGKIVMDKNDQVGYLPQQPNSNPAATVLAECMAGHHQLRDLQQQLETITAKLAHQSDPDTLTAYDTAETQFRHLGGYSWEAEATSILVGLGFDNSMLTQSPLDLSGGWRMRLELAKIFLRKPSILILDEPTNHLDLPSMLWVENYLQTFAGLVLFVSHDRALLNRLAGYIVHLQQGKLSSYPGNFNAFLEQKELKEEQVAKERENLQRQIKHHQKFVDRFGAKASKATQARSRQKMIARLQAVESGLDGKVQDLPVAMSIQVKETSGKVVLSASDLSIGYENTPPIQQDLSFEVLRQQRLAIVGANGLGKTTLLKTVCSLLPSLQGTLTYGHKVSVAYQAQDQSQVIDHDKTVLDNMLSASTALSNTEARGILGSLQLTAEDMGKSPAVLSGGELNRLGLGMLLAQKANLLILDEPTNHLDMTSVAALVGALDAYEGTIIFVSHDREFINELATDMLVLTKDGLSMHHGNLSAFDSQQLNELFHGKANQPSSLATPSQKHQKHGLGEDRQATKEKRRLKAKEQKERKKKITKLRQSIAEKEALQQELEAESEALSSKWLEVDGADGAMTRELQQQERSLSQQLSAVEEL